MRKMIIVAAVAAAVVLSAAPQAQAKSAGGVSLDNVTAFAASANYMSIPGYVRYRIFLSQGRWISREEAKNLVNNAS